MNMWTHKLILMKLEKKMKRKKKVNKTRMKTILVAIIHLNLAKLVMIAKIFYIIRINPVKLK